MERAGAGVLPLPRGAAKSSPSGFARVGAMHGHSLSFLLTAGGFAVAVLALIFQILAYRRGK